MYIVVDMDLVDMYDKHIRDITDHVDDEEYQHVHMS